MDLLKDDIRKVFIHYLVPSIGSATVMSIYYLVDFIVVGSCLLYTSSVRALSDIK